MRLLAGATLCGLSSLASAQQPDATVSWTVSGTVKDADSGEALPFASVVVKGSTRAATTNVDGRFAFVDVRTDTLTLAFSYIGYEQQEVHCRREQTAGLVVLMRAVAAQLKAAEVTATREDVMEVDRSNVSVVRMTPKKLEQLPNIGEKDILRSFQLMPGISAANESSSGLYVRGGTPDQNLILYDGITVYQVDHLYGFYSAFNSHALKDVQLYKGGFGARFGGRLSSVTEITGKDGDQNAFSAGAEVSMLSVNAFIEAPLGKKLSSIVAYRRSYKGLLYDELFSMFNSTPSGSGDKADEGGRPTLNSTVASYFYDLNGKLTFRPTDKDILSLSVYNGTDDLDNSSNDDRELSGSNSSLVSTSADLTNYGNTGSSLRWSRQWSPRLYSNTIASYSNYFSRRDNSQSKTVTDSAGVATTSSQGIFEDNDLYDVSFKSDLHYDLRGGTQLQFGAFATHYDISYTYSQNDTVTVIDRANTGDLVGAHAQANFGLMGNRLHLTPGVRASYFSPTGRAYYEPRASATYAITDKVTLKAASGLYCQFANRITREDILAGSRDFWLLSGTNGVPVSSAVHYILGAAYENDNYLFSAEGYYKSLSDITEFSLRFNPRPDGAAYSQNFFVGDGWSEGIEILAQRKFGRIKGWVSYTLSQTRNKFSIYSDEAYPAAQDVTHEFKAVAMYKWRKWNFSATWVYATGRPYTAPSGAYDVTLLDGSTQSLYTVTSKNGQRLPDYHRADIAATYTLLAGKAKRDIGYIGVSLFNVYNRTNVWYKRYSITEGEITQTNVNYLGIMPNLTISLKLNRHAAKD